MAIYHEIHDKDDKKYEISATTTTTTEKTQKLEMTTSRHIKILDQHDIQKSTFNFWKGIGTNFGHSLFDHDFRSRSLEPLFFSHSSIPSATLGN